MDERFEQEEGISLLDIFEKVKKHIVFIIISIVACVGVMGVYSVAIQKPQYVASSKVMLNASNELTGTTGLSYGLNIIGTYADFLQSDVVQERAMVITGYENVRYSTSIKNNQDSLVLVFSVTSYNPTVSITLANAIIEASIDVINSSPEGTMKSLKLASPNLFDPATTASTSRGLFKNCFIGGAIGVVIACAYVFIRMLLENTFTKPEEIEKELNLPCLAMTPYIDFSLLDENGVLIKKNKR